MTRSRITTLHSAGGAIALLTIAAFWLSALTAELALGPEATRTVRLIIVGALPILIAALATAGATGNRLAGRSKAPIVRRKLLRMKVTALNGLLVLVPSALFLGWKAWAHDFGGAFATVQRVELLTGALNVALLGLNMHDGLRMRRAKRTAGRSRDRNSNASKEAPSALARSALRGVGRAA